MFGKRILDVKSEYHFYHSLSSMFDHGLNMNSDNKNSTTNNPNKLVINGQIIKNQEFESLYQVEAYYYSCLTQLNTMLLSSMHQILKENPSSDLSPNLMDYFRYHNQLKMDLNIKFVPIFEDMMYTSNNFSQHLANNNVKFNASLPFSANPFNSVGGINKTSPNNHANFHGFSNATPVSIKMDPAVNDQLFENICEQLLTTSGASFYSSLSGQKGNNHHQNQNGLFGNVSNNNAGFGSIGPNNTNGLGHIGAHSHSNQNYVSMSNSANIGSTSLHANSSIDSKLQIQALTNIGKRLAQESAAKNESHKVKDRPSKSSTSSKNNSSNQQTNITRQSNHQNSNENHVGTAQFNHKRGGNLYTYIKTVDPSYDLKRHNNLRYHASHRSKTMEGEKVYYCCTYIRGARCPARLLVLYEPNNGKIKLFENDSPHDHTLRKSSGLHPDIKAQIDRLVAQQGGAFNAQAIYRALVVTGQAKPRYLQILTYLHNNHKKKMLNGHPASQVPIHLAYDENSTIYSTNSNINQNQHNISCNNGGINKNVSLLDNTFNSVLLGSKNIFNPNSNRISADLSQSQSNHNDNSDQTNSILNL